MILDEILRCTGDRVAALPALPGLRPDTPMRSLTGAIRSCTDRNAVIAELKYASPSRGRLTTYPAPEIVAREFAAGGAAAISVLTEPTFFGGSPGNLVRARSAVSLPILRKDFIIDERQLYETRLLGADAVLLIARVLGTSLPRFVEAACALGLEPLVEVHNRAEVELALSTGAEMIGINNRDLTTLQINLNTTRRLADLITDEGRLVVSESGILWPYDVRTLRAHCDAFLIGSAVMSAADRRKRLEGLVFA
jgi:indole-3-glycerol phosphate synthase